MQGLLSAAWLLNFWLVCCRPGDSGLVVVDYVPRQPLQANVTYESTFELDMEAGTPSSLKTFLGYLQGFRGADAPLSAEKVAIVVLKKHGVVILSALSTEPERLCCQFAPSYKQ